MSISIGMATNDDGETIQARRQRLSGVPRACEACRLRKVRCDRTTPCSNCVAAGIVCQISSPVSDARSKSDKLSKLEDRVKVLESRLRTVERQVVSKSSLLALVAEERSHTSSPTAELADLYHGDSSFASQSLQAGQLAQRTASGIVELEAPFRHLNSLLESSNALDDHRFSCENAIQPSSNAIPLPFELVTAIINRIKNRTPIFCYGYFLSNIALIENLFQKLYMFTNSHSLSHVASVLGILCFIMKELIAVSDPMCEMYDLKAYLETCEKNFKNSIQTYEILATPSFQSILALAFGALKAQEEAKPFMVCTLIAASANQCRTLGYHRQATYQNRLGADAESARRLFWSTYVSDKTLSLLLGRASNFQDIEVDTVYPEASTDPSRRPWDENFIMAIRMAQLQGQIYDRLYSPSALKSPSEERTRATNELENSMISWRDEQTQIDASSAAYIDVWNISRLHWDLIYNSTLTTLLRAPKSPGSASEITSKCFQSARLSLQSHLSCFSVWDKSNVLSGKDYANWILHYSSFTPFVVIFLHAMSVASIEDIKLLDDVVDTLEAVRETSKYAERLYQICSTLAGLVKELLKSRSVSVGAYDSQEDALQFLNHVDHSSMFQAKDLQEILGVDMTDYVNDWEAHDMATLLATWANGESTAPDMHWNSEN